MKYLVVGSGGREHAICYKLALSKKVEKVFVWPGNDGIALEDKCECIDVENEDKLVEFAKKEKIDIAIIGPENYLVSGIVDKLSQNGILAFGPDKKAAILEGSKIHAKKLMKKYGVATADFFEAYSYDEALNYLKEKNEYPIVIKADGLAAGKGVAIANDFNEAKEFCKSLFLENIFGDSGKKVVIEQYLEGYESSIIVLCDGKRFLPLLSAKDHKQVFDGNKGPNTGGMGVIAPNPLLKEKDYEKFIENIMNPTFNALKNEGLLYKGVLFFGIMVTQKGPYLLEYNVRFGDPETQAILYALKNDFSDLIDAVFSGDLGKVKLEWKQGFTCVVVLASGGYPGSFKKGFLISGLEKITDSENLDFSTKIFYSAVKKVDDKLLTNGGRVLSVVSNGKSINEARKNVYNIINKINFENMHFRKDIGVI
ncbi:MAG: phosphoribosylamine--glycine ligase [Spirochaetota bacterium]